MQLLNFEVACGCLKIAYGSCEACIAIHIRDARCFSRRLDRPFWGFSVADIAPQNFSTSDMPCSRQAHYFVVLFAFFAKLPILFLNIVGNITTIGE
jgi:hypothetical protein